VDADTSAIAEAYHRRGYTEVKVTPVVATVPGGGAPVPMDVRLEVEEGPRSVVGTIRHHRQRGCSGGGPAHRRRLA
jgi:outer membrane protein assembly factor BamA